MKGHSIAGMSITRDRVEDDFYATPTESVLKLLAVEDIIYPALEPACGDGAISKLLNGEVISTDLVNRGYGNYQADFLKDNFSKYATVITNPPFNLFQEFCEKALEIATNKVIMFGKLQALEGQKRATFMQNSPLKTVYVFKARQNPLRNGSAVDENGKPWASTMAFAWFVWEIGYVGKPTIEWI
ncbi:MAG: class I SAM-dependent methyltransferase [Mollicutes bacterium]|jgi:hypothetical protein|nr:class I SAM-dependent methyltransferase [Mollicutes bacterium]